VNPTLKALLVNIGKNAVNAILTNATLMAMLGDVFNVHTAAGWWNIGKATVGVVVGREAAVYIPKLIAWSTTSDTKELAQAQQQVVIAHEKLAEVQQKVAEKQA
jgi:hypothetical protein